MQAATSIFNPFVFQCSSASRKFLNRCSRWRAPRGARVSVLFSEPKIPQSDDAPVIFRPFRAFQCSSASRKFLNRTRALRETPHRAFQCSSASRKFLNQRESPSHADCARVSVLFSEPKIPQSERMQRIRMIVMGFSALQRAENSSIASHRTSAQCDRQVSVLFSEPKIPQSRTD